MDPVHLHLIIGAITFVATIVVNIFIAGKKAGKLEEAFLRFEKATKDVGELSHNLTELDSLRNRVILLENSTSTALKDIESIKLEVALLKTSTINQLRQWEKLETTVSDLMVTSSGRDVNISTIKDSLNRIIDGLDNIKQRVSSVEAKVK